MLCIGFALRLEIRFALRFLTNLPLPALAYNLRCQWCRTCARTTFLGCRSGTWMKRMRGSRLLAEGPAGITVVTCLALLYACRSASGDDLPGSGGGFHGGVCWTPPAWLFSAPAV